MSGFLSIVQILLLLECTFSFAITFKNFFLTYRAASKKPSAAVKPLLREDLNTTTPSPTEPLSPIKIIVYDADTEETKKILSPEEKEAERQKAEEEELNKRNAEETEEAKSVSPPTPVIEEVTLGIDGDESFDSIKIAHVVFNKTPTPDEYDEYEDEVILEKANLSKVSSTSEDNLTVRISSWNSKHASFGPGIFKAGGGGGGGRVDATLPKGFSSF